MQRNYCRSILLLWYRPSHSLWINLWTCMVSELSRHLWEATIGLLHFLWFISVCVGHLSAVFTPSRHCFYRTESSFYFFAACPTYPAKESHYYRPTSVDTALKGITKNIHITINHTKCSRSNNPNLTYQTAFAITKPRAAGKATSSTNREVNEERRPPHTCSSPCAFEVKKTK